MCINMYQLPPFLLSRSKLTQGTVFESKLRGELEVLVAMVAEYCPDSLLYSLKQQSVSSLFINHDIKVYTRVTTQAKCGEWINFIDDLNIPQDQQQKAQLVDFVISHKNGEFLKARSCLSFLRKNSIILSSLWLDL